MGRPVDLSTRGNWMPFVALTLIAGGAQPVGSQGSCPNAE
jgi:hypothetical protein